WDRQEWLGHLEECGADFRRAADGYYRGSNHGSLAFMGSNGCTCSNTTLWTANWEPAGCELLKWDAEAFCRILGGRSLLLIGDSTQEQTASTLMNIARPFCADKISFEYGDTAIGEYLGGPCNRGRPWNASVVLRSPDIVLLNAGAHIKRTLSEFEAVLEQIAEGYARLRQGGSNVKLIWKTQNPG
ncbi:unnamed protein product, partial [Phaeothamnion confervicola]